jgi:hypothetical protein
VRLLLALVLVLAAGCDRADRREAAPAAADAPSAPTQSGPDALLLRVPRGGGTAEVVAYPRTDSVVWTSDAPLPALDHVLAFDEEAGLVAAVDAKGGAVRLDLRTGDVSRAGRGPLQEAASSDAEAIYGLGPKGTVVRHTRAGSWTFTPPRPARAVFPRPDGSVLVLGGREGSTTLWRVRPPGTRAADSLTLPHTERWLGAPGADRVYFVVEGGLAAVQGRTMQLSNVELDEPAIDLASTPSGDRVFVLSGTKGDRVEVVDRYQDRVSQRIELPGRGESLRIDAAGRYLLVRASGGDSLWVVAVGTGRVLGALRSRWRGDIPFVAPDGAVAVAQGANLVFYDGETLRQVGRVENGAVDFWFPFRWNGFRPRDPSLDRPVTFGESVAAADSMATTADSAAADSTARPDSAAAAPAARGWTVSFAALLAEDRARELASRISVGGQAARVVASARGATTVYRVVLGPYATREEAERVGRESGQSYWIFEGAP